MLIWRPNQQLSPDPHPIYSDWKVYVFHILMCFSITNLVVASASCAALVRVAMWSTLIRDIIMKAGKMALWIWFSSLEVKEDWMIKSIRQPLIYQLLTGSMNAFVSGDEEELVIWEIFPEQAVFILWFPVHGDDCQY